MFIEYRFKILMQCPVVKYSQIPGQIQSVHELDQKSGKYSWDLQWKNMVVSI